MKNLFRSHFFSLIIVIALFSSFTVIAQEASLGFSEKSGFINRDAECNGPGQLKYDDGTFENGYGWNNTVTDGRYVMLFTPTTYPWDFNTFCIALSRLAAGPSSLTFDIVVYDNTGAGGAPGNLVATVPGVVATGIPVWTTLAWYDFPLTGVPSLASGSYYIGAKWDASTLSGLVALGADQSPTTTLQPGYSWANAGPWTTLTSGFPDYRALGMRTLGSSSVGPGFATDPSPANNATNVSAPDVTLSWTNPGTATSCNVYFGTNPASLTQIHTGSLITSIPRTGLAYNTVYYWRVDEIDGTGTTSGPVWSFRTMEDPAIVTLFLDDFSAGIGNWTVTNEPGQTPGCEWKVGPRLSGYTLPGTGNVMAADVDACGSGSTLNSTATLNAPIDATLYQAVELSFANDFRHLGTAACFVEVSTNGTVWTQVWTFSGASLRNTTETINISAQVALSNFWIRFRSVQPGWYWWWILDDVKVRGWDIIPVELTAFTASVIGNNVTLNWSTASETNNNGFQVEQNNGTGYRSVGFVSGFGTTTEAKSYSFSDQSLVPGTYTYRLKQIDFDGTFAYSQSVEVEVGAPKEFALNQNFPNPFNPSTMITFSLAADAKVTLKVFDVLGQEVMTLVNNNLSAGAHEYNFDASSFNSGVYFYRIEASGIDGKNFTAVKKMILTK